MGEGGGLGGEGGGGGGSGVIRKLIAPVTFLGALIKSAAQQRERRRLAEGGAEVRAGGCAWRSPVNGKVMHIEVRNDWSVGNHVQPATSPL